MTHTLFGVRMNDLSHDELIATLRAWLHSDRAHLVVTPNPEFLLQARHDGAFRDLLNQADLALPDGVGLRYAVAALTDERLRNRHTGVDAFMELAALCAGEGKRLVLLGADPGVAERTAERLSSTNPGLDVVGMDPGKVSADGHFTADVIDRLRALEPTAVAVALGQGKQERAMAALLASLPSLRVAIGVGGAFNTVSGRLQRAPNWMRRAGLEWLWRVGIEPRRVGRILRASVLFPAVVAYGTLKSHRFIKACRHVFPEILRQFSGL